MGEPETPRRGLTVITVGIGRDSTTILCLLAEGRLVADGELLRPADVAAVVFSDTGAEWPSTYAQIPKVRALCEGMGVRFIVAAKPAEDGPTGWRAHLRARGDRTDPAWVTASEGLSIEQRAERGGYHRRLPIIWEYMRFGKIAIIQSGACTDVHKTQVIRRVLCDLSEEILGVGSAAWGRLVKKGLATPHRILIGFAADEMDRVEDEGGRPLYERAVFPLVEMGIGKGDEAPILERWGFADMHKSGCYNCPYQPTGWFWVLSVRYPALFALVADQYEAEALANNPKMFVRDRKPLRVAVEDWRRLNPTAREDDMIAKAYCRGRAARVLDERQQQLFAA